MSTMQRITLIGLYNYDASLFDLLSLPEGYDKDTFIDSFLLEHGEKCVLYTDPDFMKFSIGAVSRKWQLELSRIYDALSAEYNPIYNYDRYEEYEDTEGITKGGTMTNKPNFDVKTVPNLSTTSSQTVGGSTETQKAAFNSSTYEPDTKVLENAGTNQVSQTGNTNTNTSGTTDNIETSDSEDRTLNHEAHLYGNIGVTTSVQMWSEEVRERMNKNLYGIAGRIFANELLIQLY